MSAATPAPMTGHGARPARRERGAPDRVREARARLTSGRQGKPELEYELLHMFVKNELAAMLTIPLLAVIIALASMFWADPVEPFVWLAVLLVARAVLVRFCKRFADTPKAEINVDWWRQTLTAAEALYGVAWAGIVLVGLNPSEPSAHIFVFASLIVVSTLRLLFASTMMSIVYAGTVPMMLAGIGLFFWSRRST